MFTRIEIDGFKTFTDFSVDLEPFTAIVGPNATGKSNLFDAIRLLSLLSSTDIRNAMLLLRGEPRELFRKTNKGQEGDIKISAEVLLPPRGEDQFGSKIEVKAQRLRYEVALTANKDARGNITGFYVSHEFCGRIKKSSDRSKFVKETTGISYGGNIPDFLTTIEDGGRVAFRVRQDGPNKSGKPRLIPAYQSSKTALSTIDTSEFPTLYQLRHFLSSAAFLEINPTEARKETDIFQTKQLLPNAANLASVLARIRDETQSDENPEGALTDISLDLARLIPSTKKVHSISTHDESGYSYEIEMTEGLKFSSRVISDGTLRLLVLITALNDPKRSGLLCFEEPENGIHEGRVETVVELMRDATRTVTEDYFQILVNTHSPAVMQALQEREILAADIVTVHTSGFTDRRTRMRPASQTGDLVNPEAFLTKFELDRILRKSVDAA